MTIQAQLALFFLRFGEPADNSKVSPDQALGYINLKRDTESKELKFYKIKDFVAATSGGETKWTFGDNFFGPRPGVKDWAIYDGAPLIEKPQTIWAEITSSNAISNPIYNNNRFFMYENNIFHINFEAEAGKRIEWLGYGRPPELGALTGPDVYLTREQAQLTVFAAVIAAKNDAGDRIGQTLYDDYKKLEKAISAIVDPFGARLEPPPGNYGY